MHRINSVLGGLEGVLGQFGAVFFEGQRQDCLLFLTALRGIQVAPSERWPACAPWASLPSLKRHVLPLSSESSPASFSPAECQEEQQLEVAEHEHHASVAGEQGALQQRTRAVEYAPPAISARGISIAVEDMSRMWCLQVQSSPQVTKVDKRWRDLGRRRRLGTATTGV